MKSIVFEYIVIDNYNRNVVSHEDIIICMSTRVIIESTFFSCLLLYAQWFHHYDLGCVRFRYSRRFSSVSNRIQLFPPVPHCLYISCFLLIVVINLF